MASIGTWRAPLPFRVGGGGHKAISEIYAELNANIGTGLSTDENSINDIETKSVARALSIAQRAIDRRVAQIDAFKLTTLLERWETIFGIVPGPDDTENDRRRTVAARMELNRAALDTGLSEMAETAFWPWKTRLHFTPNASAMKKWPAGVGDEASTAADFWVSTVAHFVVEFERPAGASDQDVNARKTACLEALHEYTAAWSTFDTSETQEGLEYGFALDVPNLNVSCLGA